MKTHEIGHDGKPVYHDVKPIFEEEMSHLKIDVHLVKRIVDFQVGFVNKNEDHMTFFGGNTTGVQIVRFMPADREKWFTDVIQADDITLEEKLRALPAINDKFHISSDTFNLSIVWILHAIKNSPLLTDKQKKMGMMSAALVLNYKFLTSLMYWWFKYLVDPEVAQVVYAQLSLKFALKQHGSWQAVLEFRCESLLAENSIHADTIKDFYVDGDIVYMLNDTQGRIRDMLKNIYGVLDRVSKQKTRIFSTSATFEFEGEEILKDKTKNLAGYTRYMHSIVSDKNTFIKDELIIVISNIQHTMSSKHLVKTLQWISDNYRGNSTVSLEAFVDSVLVHSFSYLSDHRNLVRQTNDLAQLIGNLRGVYMSSRSTDVELLDVRQSAEDIVVHATGIRNESAIASIRTGLLLYVVLRAYSMHHYA